MRDEDVNIFVGEVLKICKDSKIEKPSYSNMDTTTFICFELGEHMIKLYVEKQKNGGYLIEIMHYPPNTGARMIKENDHWMALDRLNKLIKEIKEEIKVEFKYGDIIEFKDGGYGAIISEGFQEVKVYWFGTGREDWEDPQDLTLVRNALTYPTFGNGFVLEANEESLVKLSSIDRVYVEDNYVWAMSNDVPSLLFVGSYEQCREYVKHWVTCYDF